MSLESFTPSGEIRILKNVGLDSHYNDTYTFASRGAQTQFFISHTVFTYTNAAPVRIPLAIRVGVNANQVYNCDYLMFQNENFSDKWFYAFITNVKWVNINLCEIEYEIDVLQTWFFDMQYVPVFVEREHSSTDNPGDNLIPEGLEIGDPIIGLSTFSGYLQDLNYVVWTTFQSGSTSTIGLLGGIYSGLYMNVFTSASALNTFIIETVAQAKGDGIIAINMIPSQFISSSSSHPLLTKTFQMTLFPTMSGKSGGYVPKNKKLLTYPFRYLLVSNQNGNAGTFRIEYFNYGVNNLANKTVSFTISCDLTPNPTAVAIPLNYRKYSETSGEWDSSVSLAGFPLCAWSSDTYTAWLAQNSNTLLYNQQSNFIKTGMGILSNALSLNVGGAINAGVSGALSIGSQLAAMEDKQALPPQAHGEPMSYIQVAMAEKDFRFTVFHPTEELMKSIDSYFDLFGYATHQVKIPNIFGRLSWNYVKTNGSFIHGDIPTDAVNKIEDIFSNGIRFWHGNYIGDYTRPNNIVEGPVG